MTGSTRWFLTGIMACSLGLSAMAWSGQRDNTWDSAVYRSFSAQGITLTASQLNQIRANVRLGAQEACRHGTGNSKVKFSAVEIAADLQLNPKVDTSLVPRITNALAAVSREALPACNLVNPVPSDISPTIETSWNAYYDDTIALGSDTHFLSLLSEKQFFPVKISWEDIGRTENSVWGDRISDVGIWVRKNEHDPGSANLALSVRRDSNFRDKILVVPANQIKIHLKRGTQTTEVSLPERLRQLGLSSPTRDRNVIVSNQFAIVPVPPRASDRWGTRWEDAPPRAAFNFSIYPYGSTNYVITDVIEGSSDAVVGAGTHQLLYANINGKKAPFTASRAEDRPDLKRLENALKAQGMDVDVQRYYLIQIPLRKNSRSITLSNMGTPPMANMHTGYPFLEDAGIYTEMNSGTATAGAPAASVKSDSFSLSKLKPQMRSEAGLSKVAIGHGDAEGVYRTGSGYRGLRADEPIRVTVVYFVTPVGVVSQADMDAFTKTFSQWDEQALWGGSFVTKN